MKIVSILFGLSCVFLNSCSGIKNTYEPPKNRLLVIPLSSILDCKQDLLCEYTPWFAKTPSEIKSLQKEYGIYSKASTVKISFPLDKNENIERLKTDIGCREGYIDKIITVQNKLLFACKVSLNKEFRYTIYFGEVNGSRLKLWIIDEGGGMVK